MPAIIIAPLDDLGSAVPAISELIRTHGAEIPPKVWTDLSKMYSSPVEQIATCAESLYAMAVQLPDGDARTQAATLAAKLAMKCTEHQWWAIGQTTRGLRMTLAMRRVLGDDTITQVEADDPRVLADYGPDATASSQDATAVEPAA